MDKRYIGVFDSGLGGLTVLKEIQRELPNENTIYFGDIARVPYGPKSESEIVEYTKQAIDFLISKDVKVVVIACNTATARALAKVKNRYRVPVIGVIDGGVKTAIMSTKNKKIGVIGTEGTINSDQYNKKIKEIDNEIYVYSKACPPFVELVENGEIGTAKSKSVVSKCLEVYKDKNIDTLVLGCTHYPHLRDEIREALGDNVTLVDPAIETVKSLKKIILSEGIENKSNSRGECSYYASLKSGRFKEIAARLMEKEIKEIRVVDIKSSEKGM